MLPDTIISEESHSYFLTEAQDLLQSIEQDLLGLREDRTPAKVHNLMRAAHTLKGAAASVDMEMMKNVAHVLEDVFKALYNPDVVIDIELESLLFQGYECLRLCLEPKAMQAADEMANRAATIMAELQTKLGDFLNQENSIPTSAELGFDVVQSIFEMGVKQRLDELALALTNPDAVQIGTNLKTYAEIFLGLAESLNLPGWGAIASAILSALAAHPDRAIEIAEVALADLQQGHSVILAGDRIQGGTPSLALQQLAGISLDSNDLLETNQLPFPNSADSPAFLEDSLLPSLKSLDELPFPSPASSATFLEDSFLSGLENLDQLPFPNPTDSPTFPGDSSLPSLESLFETFEPTPPLAVNPSSDESLESKIVDTSDESKNNSIPEHRTTPTTRESLQLAVPPPPSPLQPQPILTEVKPQKTVFQQSVRVNVEQLEHLNYLAGELVVNQNKQAAEVEKLRKVVRELLDKSQRHHQTMNQLRDWADRMRSGKWQWLGGKSQASQELAYLPISSVQFDPLEMDNYSELDVLLKSALEETAQLETITEVIDLSAKQSNLTLEKQQRFLANVRDDLTEARMQPIGELLNRFPRVLQQLSATHNKPVELILTGTEVLVDKAIAEKLYDPLLHLIRNAFDHGIEPPAIRQTQGKPAEGRIELRAYYQGNRTIIEVRDDGKGLDFQRICQKAVEVKLLTAEQASSVSEAQLLDLLFEPGFSTASKLSDLSGRGVGLDVVRSQLQLLKGSATIKSQPQQGTSFFLQIPLSLTITKLMLCQANSMTYALAVEAVEQILLPQPDQIRWLSGQRILHWYSGRTECTVPIHRLSDLVAYSERVSELSVFTGEPTTSTQFALAANEATTLNTPQSPILLLHYGTELYGLEVDQIVGEQELVIRPLGSTIAPPKYVYGASILSNSQMALAIDVTLLVNQFLNLGESKQVREYHTLSSAADLSLPLAASSSSHPASPTPAPEQPTKRTVPKVLVIDDSVTIRQSLTSTLQKAGYQVLQATDGLEALDQLQRHKGTQLVAICDVEMPRMNGFEFLTQCRQHPTLSQVPIVMLTSRSSDKYRHIASELGANGYLTKPYSEQELLTAVSSLLHKAGQVPVLS
ncbi:MAG TPA: hybrid sensor histidine kinase/response regulator [Cyanobacteria bacterium UBA11049]|nr:hybrid sensor histidine kinase/response regulator [Cyanobacteria bacterium UBA11049]